MKTIAVYIMSNKKNGTLYIGVTSDLITRVYQHKQNYSKKSFTAKYGLHRLVYFEIHSDMFYAIEREIQLKNWLRSWKIELIESQNPTWKDLWYEIIQ